MLPSTTQRVALHSSQKANAKIRRDAQKRLSHYFEQPEKMDTRLKQLDRDWDIERSLEANGSTLLLLGLGLGTFLNRKWYLLPFFVGAFCLQHALQGWCPPIEVFRRLGVRTSREIEEERTALKALRGDFHALNGRKRKRIPIAKVVTAVRK
jgi:hypothetical protein